MREIECRLKWFLRAFPHDLCRNAPRRRLLTKLSKDALQLLCGCVVHKVGGSRGNAHSIHTHIERSFFHERKPATWRVELPRGNAKVEQRAVNLRDAKVIE